MLGIAPPTTHTCDSLTLLPPRFPAEQSLCLWCVSLDRFELLSRPDEDGPYLPLLELVAGLVLVNKPEPFGEKIRT